MHEFKILLDSLISLHPHTCIHTINMNNSFPTNIHLNIHRLFRQKANQIHVKGKVPTNNARIYNLDWLQSLKQFFINVSYHILVASLTLMARF